MTTMTMFPTFWTILLTGCVALLGVIAVALIYMDGRGDGGE